MSTFVPTRSLLNHQFEGYKLSFTPSPDLQYVPLPQRATQSRIGISSWGFQEVASRVRHNHLAVGGDTAMFVAEDGNVVLVRLDRGHSDVNNQLDEVSLRVVFQLPEYVSGSASVHAEYPAAACLSEDMWLVSDGHGMAFLIRIPDDHSPAQLLASWELLIDNNTTVPSPFQLHNATMVAPHLAIAILSSRAPSSNEPSSSKMKEQLMFDVWAVHVPLSETSHSSAVPFEVRWRRRGTDIPLFVTYVPSRDASLLIGGSSYYDVASQPVQPYDPTPDELMPIPRAGDIDDAAVVEPPPYSWTQTDDSVTAAFALPGTTPKTNIHTLFERSKLSIHAGDPPLTQPRYDGAPLWDTIHPTSSLWTWERGTLTSSGLFTIHLDKARPGTRWSHVFAQGFEKDEVPETLDPSELANIRETLDKYTASLQENANELGQGVPSLADGERDNEVDSSVGQSVLLTWVANDGSACGPADDSPVVILSLPLPGTKKDPPPLSLVVKNDIDGLLYTFDDAELVWKHTATYPALGFVLASKRDTRFTFHVSASAVLAFDSGARNSGGGNVYIYRGSAQGDKWAKQAVFQQPVGGGTLLGVGSLLSSRDGQRVLLCLSERELTVCRQVC